MGCAVGDAQCYTLFCDFLDRIIEAYHGCKVSGPAPKSDFNSENLKVALPPAKSSRSDAVVRTEVCVFLCVVCPPGHHRR